MKPKQLANVLIKILGLSMIAHGISGLINGVLGWLQFTSDNHLPVFADPGRNSHYWMMVLYALFPLAIGLVLMVGSRWLAEKLFKDEVE
jgi:uncharacterized membrane protein